MTTAQRAPRARSPRKPAATPPANPERGEHSITLGRKTYRLRPSFTANITIENETGRSLIELYRLAGAGGLALEELGILAAEYIRAGADEKDSLTRAVDAGRIAELIYEEGIHKATARLTVCLQAAITGGCDLLGEAKAAPAMARSDAGAA